MRNKSNMHFVINGKGGSGKDTFIKYVTKYILQQRSHITVDNFSSIDEIKHIAKKYFGWNGNKDLPSRKLLSDLKQLQIQSCDGPFNFLSKQFNEQHVQFFHIREPEEIEKFVESFPNTKTVLITREDIDQDYGNKSDDQVLDFYYDIVIENEGAEVDLKQKAELFTELFVKIY